MKSLIHNIKDNITQTDIKKSVLQCAAIFIAVFFLLSLGNIFHQELLIASFGATCVILFCFPKSNFSKPQNTIGGYIICSIIGILIYKTIGNNTLGIALALSLSIFIMIQTGLVHPPAAAATVIVMQRCVDWYFVLTPIILGAVVISLIAFAFNKAYEKIDNNKKTDVINE